MQLTQIKSFFNLKWILAGTILLSLTACMTPMPTDPEALKQYHEANDPFEPYNRGATTFNMWVNEYIFTPFSKAYRFILPKPVRTGVANFSDNLKQPYIFVNSILQGDFESGAQSFGRFFTNTTIGIGGLFDPATALEIQAPRKDFGQTLYTWGIKKDGPYLVLPFFGPSNMRDAFGMGIGFFIDPIDWTLPKAEKGLLWYRYGIQWIVAADSATDLLTNVEQSSVDPYTTLRTMYRQNRSKFLRGDAVAQESYDFSFDDDEEDMLE